MYLEIKHVRKLLAKTCRDCGGTGYSFGGQCERCEGTGDEDYGRPRDNAKLVQKIFSHS